MRADDSSWPSSYDKEARSARAIPFLHVIGRAASMQQVSPIDCPSQPEQTARAAALRDPEPLRRQRVDLARDFRLSVIVPVLNERRTLPQVVQKIRATEIPCEIILVDDGSTDGSRELIQSWEDLPDIRVSLHASNCGKGAAVRTGCELATGDAVVVQDADLEYDPHDFWRLLEPILAREADVVFGSRFAEPRGRVSPRWHRAANGLLTMAANTALGLALTDMETCYKMVRRDVLQQVLPHLCETGFGIEPELTARLARLPGVRIREVPISYQGRTYAAGKKIRARDGLWALWCIVRYGLLKR
jgi:glycosyltransferase involved in cell wall biosynthesis